METLIKIIGVGPGSPKFLSQVAIDIIENGTNILAFERIAKDLKDLNPNIQVVKKVDEAIEILAQKDQGILLASGDALFFGIGDLVQRKGLVVDEIIPGLSSVQYLYNKLKKSYSSNVTLSVHGRDVDFSQLEPGGLYSFLIDDKRGANYISRELNQLNYKGKLYAGYNLSYDDESIFSFDIGETIEEPCELGVVVVELEDTKR